MPRPTSGAENAPVRIVVVTLDNHLASAAARAEHAIQADVPGLRIALHATATWQDDPDARERCLADIAEADIVVATMLFMDEHIRSVLPALQARRDACDAFISFMSSGEVMKLTRMGQLDFGQEARGILGLLKRLKGSGRSNTARSSGEKQMAMLRRIPRLLRFIPGTAQDLRAYFITMQYWLAGSDENFTNLIRHLVNRYASGPRAELKGQLTAAPPVTYPEVGIYHPTLPERLSSDPDALICRHDPAKPTVGIIVMRSYLLAGNASHYDGVISAIEARGMNALPVFACGLDARPAIERFLKRDGSPVIDALVSLTGFSLVGGPAYNDAEAAAATLTELDVPYIAAQAIEFQTLDQWQSSDRGLLPVEATIMVAIPELDGATGSMLYGGRAGGEVPASVTAHAGGRPQLNACDMQPHLERADMLAARVAKLIALRTTPRENRKIGIVLFNFPPNGGAVGTAAFLSVYESLLATLRGLAQAGYTVDVPATADELRERIIGGNAQMYGTPANVHARISADDHVRREPHLSEIEAQWGPAPGRQQALGSDILVLGATFGDVFVGVQPAFGYEGDPMRLLFEKSFAPTHAFSAFYRYLREDFGAHAVLHFGTHGALEFMPGKQTALSNACWPDRLIGDLPNIYLYAANNPSEGAIAKRRASATLVSYLTPAITQAGLYKGLFDLKASLARWRELPPENEAERTRLAPLIQAQAAEFDLAAAEPEWTSESFAEIMSVNDALMELEHTLIPTGMHIAGQGMSGDALADMLAAIAAVGPIGSCDPAAFAALAAGGTANDAMTASGLRPTSQLRDAFSELAATAEKLSANAEIDAIIHALDGRFVPPSPSGDLVRTTDILPTGRNIHGFDPFRMPSAFALKDGAEQADRLVARHVAESGRIPETIAFVLWGTDNLKSEGGPIGQVLALMGAEPRFDAYGRLCGAQLIPAEKLSRPRIDVMVTLSGIFRDLLPLQTKLLAEAALLAAQADEPPTRNFIRKHALAYAAENDCDLETAALRVFSNADGAYGSNVNHLIEDATWEDEDEIADVFARRKSFAYNTSGKPTQQTDVMKSVLGQIDLAYQNLESIELGVTTIDHYFDTLGGISRAAERERGTAISVYIGDQTRGKGHVRTLSEQVALETRTRALNPKWYEGMLAHGYEGVRQIEAMVTNTMGWSATTGQVAPGIYQQLTQTYVLDPDMRARLAELNPAASAKVANRLIEASARSYWSPDEETLNALREAGDELEDRLEGIHAETAEGEFAA
ncbi:MAG: magnesium chelatase subunit H [Pseudomonadota bacterium]